MTGAKSRGVEALSMVNPGAAAIDIGSTMHMAAVNPNADDNPVRAFGTFTGDLHDMARWFKACGVTSVAMESTGVYWIPAYEVLEEHGFHVILVNARYAKNVPGRKTDVSDAAWLQRLHSYGLLRDIRCHASIEKICAALSGNWRDEHIFALCQSLALYDFYQIKILECDRKLEIALKALAMVAFPRFGPKPSR